MINTDMAFTAAGVEFTFHDDESTVQLTWWQFVKWIISNPKELWRNPNIIKGIAKLVWLRLSPFSV